MGTGQLISDVCHLMKRWHHLNQIVQSENNCYSSIRVASTDVKNSHQKITSRDVFYSPQIICKSLVLKTPISIAHLAGAIE